MKMSKAVRESTGFVAKGVAVSTVVLLVVFFILHLFVPGVPFGWKVVLGGVLGYVVAVGNFLIMAIVAEKAAADDNFDNAKRQMAVSYRYRTLAQIVFIVLALVLPFINAVAAIIPLLIPGFLIRGKGVWDYRKKR